jgi:hypothetical protein
VESAVREAVEDLLVAQDPVAQARVVRWARLLAKAEATGHMGLVTDLLGEMVA